MADILSQLQTALTQLSDQFTASLAYTLTSSSPSALETSTSQPPIPLPTPTPQQSQPQPQSPTRTATAPTAREDFLSAQKELATDLILKIREIEYLIGRLPGLENSTERQRARIRELEQEMQEVEAERREVVSERERGVEVLEGVLAGVRRW